MNYQHLFHAGNYADVLKHAILTSLVLGLQKKEKGFLYLDTHAGAGQYDLTQAARGDSLARTPEWPNGIGRLWGRFDEARAMAPLAAYLEQVRAFDAWMGVGDAGTAGPRMYPGSPRLVQGLARPQDRLALCELDPDAFEDLTDALGHERRISLHRMDGYTALKAMLPPLERRALVLIDPPFEAADELLRVVEALREGLRRMPAATYAIWYPLTERARVDAFLSRVRGLNPPPTWTVELTTEGPESPAKMKGCGLVVINPPWQLDRALQPTLAFLSDALTERPGASTLTWLVPER